jgi:hypothetical protein
VIEVVADGVGLPAPELAVGAGEVLVDQRGLAEREERRGVLVVDVPVDGHVIADRVRIGEVRLVLGRLGIPVAGRRDLREQRRQQVLLPGEVPVEGPGRPPGLGCDVGDLGVQVAAADEQALGRLDQRGPGLGRLLCACHQRSLRFP